MKAKEYLLQIQRIDEVIRTKTEEIHHWQDISTSLTQSLGERVQSSASRGNVESSVCRYVDIQTDIKEEINKLVDIRHEVMLTIEQLKTLEYSVIYERYINGKTFAEIAGSLNRSTSSVASIHGRALQNVQKIIDKEK